MWERLRRPVTQAWLIDQDRPYDWAKVGATAEAAVWGQLVRAEALDPDADTFESEAVGTVLLDLVKCFENVRLAQVWQWGCYWGV